MREVSILIENTCCFFGHRTINETEELKSKIIEIIEKLIVDENVDTFLFEYLLGIYCVPGIVLSPGDTGNMSKVDKNPYSDGIYSLELIKQSFLCSPRSIFSRARRFWKRFYISATVF